MKKRRKKEETKGVTENKLGGLRLSPRKKEEKEGGEIEYKKKGYKKKQVTRWAPHSEQCRRATRFLSAASAG